MDKRTSLLKPYFQERALTIAFGLLSLIIVDILQLLIPRVIKRVVDDLTLLQVSFFSLFVYALIIAGIAILMGGFRYIWRRCLLGTSRRIEEGLRNQLFAHIQTLSAPYFDRTATGDLMAHATNDLHQIGMATGMGMVAMNDAIFLGLATIGFMAYINAQLTFYILIPMPCIVLGTLIFTRKMHHRYQQVQRKFSELTETVRECFAGIRLIKAYNLEEPRWFQVNRFSQAYVKENLELAKIIGLFFPMMILFSNLSMAAVLFFGGKQTILRTITAGDFAAFISYLGLLTWPMMAMGWVINLIQRGRASLDRVRTILETQPEIQDPEMPSNQPLSSPMEIVFERVSFAYSGTHHTVLQDLSFCLKPRSLTGIIGPPGSGKTTLLNLVPRLYDPNQGGIFLNGQDIRSLKLKDLRAVIAFVPQEPFLFSGTVRDNITFGQDFSDDTLEQALKRSALTQTIRELPFGLETQVGEKGITLSGGQKQRIALARAFIQNKPILLCDDPVSQVDTQTGETIMDSISALSRDKTCLIVSHRLAALRTARTILVLTDGQLVDKGAHKELMASSSYYASTFHLQQLKEEIDAY
jgi:ATP-binding cassette subfamily B protein